MEDSVQAYINAQPESVMSKDQFWQENYAGYKDGILKGPNHYNDLNYKIAKFFGHGIENQFESEYEAYLNNVNNRNEFLAQQSARAYDKMMDDSKVQRMMADYQKAGLNPYLLVNSGTVSASSSPSGAKAGYGAKNTQESKGTGGRDFALILLAVARLAAALL